MVPVPERPIAVLADVSLPPLPVIVTSGRWILPDPHTVGIQKAQTIEADHIAPI
jgi:hypothetical protein